MLLTAFREVADRTPDAVAVEVPDSEQATYAQLSERIEHIAAGLRARGAGAGRTVATWLDNGIDYVAVILALAGTGAVHVPVSRSADPQHIAWLLGRTEPSLIVSARPLPGATAETVSPAGLAAEGRAAAAAGPAPESVSASAQRHAGLFRLLETTGSTGRPRLVQWRQDDLLRDRRQWIEYTGTDAGDVVFNRHTLDVAHGCDVHLFPALLSGARLILADPAAPPERLLRWLERTGASVHSALPRHYDQLIEACAALERPARLSALRLPLCGGAYLDSRTVDAAAKSLGIRMRRIYGSTEFGIVLGNMEDTVQTERGMSPVTGVEVRLEPIGRDRPEIGELLARSPHTSRGYFQDDEANAARFTEGWYRTGDVAEARGGEYRILGRVSDVLRGRHGPVLAPAVEAELAARCRIVEAVVLAPAEADQRAATLVLAAPAEGVARRELIEGLRSVLDELGVAGEIRLVPSIPHTAVGKADRSSIRRDWATFAAS